jgi:DNA polymerase V
MNDATGFPSPAQGYEEKTIDFNRLLKMHLQSTYVMKMVSSDLIYKGIFPQSYLLIDRSKKPQVGKLGLFSYQGEFYCREIGINPENKEISFFSPPDQYLSLLNSDLVFFGLVTANVRELL